MKSAGLFLKRVAVLSAVTVALPFFSVWIQRDIPQIFAESGEFFSLDDGDNSDDENGYTITFFENEMLSFGSPVDETKITPEISEKNASEGPLPYPDILENKSGKITALCFGRQRGDNYFSLVGGAQVQNITDVDNSVLMKESYELPEFRLKRNGEKEILIMHTHTTESYEPYTRDFYDDSFISRTTDESRNTVAVGEEIAKQLEEAGFGVIHDKTIHDYPSYNGSYDRSAVTVKNILKQYPSIKIVLDIHRDAIEREGGERIAPTAIIDGEPSAQIMIISGCDSGNMGYPLYLKNFRLACLFQRHIYADYKELARPILFTYKKYNQNLTTGSLLIEVGGHANSIDEVKRSGEYLGKAISSALCEIS